MSEAAPRASIAALIDVLIQKLPHVPAGARPIEARSALPVTLQALAEPASDRKAWRAWGLGQRVWFVIARTLPNSGSDGSASRALQMVVHDESGRFLASALWLHDGTRWQLSGASGDTTIVRRLDLGAAPQAPVAVETGASKAYLASEVFNALYPGSGQPARESEIRIECTGCARNVTLADCTVHRGPVTEYRCAKCQSVLLAIERSTEGPTRGRGWLAKGWLLRNAGDLRWRGLFYPAAPQAFSAEPAPESMAVVESARLARRS